MPLICPLSFIIVWVYSWSPWWLVEVAAWNKSCFSRCQLGQCERKPREEVPQCGSLMENVSFIPPLPFIISGQSCQEGKLVNLKQMKNNSPWKVRTHYEVCWWWSLCPEYNYGTRNKGVFVQVNLAWTLKVVCWSYLERSFTGILITQIGNDFNNLTIPGHFLVTSQYFPTESRADHKIIISHFYRECVTATLSFLTVLFWGKWLL